jgi:hypothetical protein
MTMRTRRNLITFPHPSFLQTLETVVPSGTYKLDTDEEIIDGRPFSCCLPAHGDLATSSLNQHGKWPKPTDPRTTFRTRVGLRIRRQSSLICLDAIVLRCATPDLIEY